MEKYIPYTNKIFTNRISASKDADNNYNTVSSDPKVNKELVTTLFSIKVYDKNGKEIEIYDYTPAVYGQGDNVNAKAADVLVPEGDSFKIIQRNHYHATANGLLGEYSIYGRKSSRVKSIQYIHKSLFPSSFPDYKTEHFSNTDINASHVMELPSGLGTPGYYDLFNRKYDLGSTSWIYDPSTNQVEYLGKIDNFDKYNSNIWYLNDKGEPKIKETIIKNGESIELEVLKRKGINK